MSPAEETFKRDEFVVRPVNLVGARRFWVYRGEHDPADFDAAERRLSAAFEALAADFDAEAGGPIGLCVPISSRTLLDAHPEAVWQRSQLMYAGYLAGGEQVRIRYFDDAPIALGANANHGDTRLEPGLRVLPFAEQDVVGPEDVIALWQREGVLGLEEAKRRVHEVLLVGVTDDGQLAGISSTYLQRNAQLGMFLWYYRAFVANSHRGSNLALNLAMRGRDLLRERFVSGTDRRGAGAIYEVENPGLKSYFNLATWQPTEFTFIGESEHGAHVRVHFFPGAEAPPFTISAGGRLGT